MFSLFLEQAEAARSEAQQAASQFEERAFVASQGEAKVQKGAKMKPASGHKLAALQLERQASMLVETGGVA